MAREAVAFTYSKFALAIVRCRDVARNRNARSCVEIWNVGSVSDWDLLEVAMWGDMHIRQGPTSPAV